MTVSGKASDEMTPGQVADIRRKTGFGVAMTDYLVILEPTSTGWGAWSPDLSVYATGATREETVDRIRDAIAFHIDGLKAAGDPIPEPATDSVLVGA